ncbi:MAG TPA: bifunctional methylenetetrahydrofolate dehydrogenase/methenyltetrahydrofolate cyclohydrolase FolD [Nitrospinota bacterium]|nr:bifunctional methylenetetrahydrofolate dehydrogenase/methenyltetrahydrofolate cyclohydrolase FolD [Nitrospinota bacterium]
MSAKIIDGNKIADEIRGEIKKEVESLKSQNNITPGLAAVLVGDNPASQVYVRMKRKACKEIGIFSEEYNLPANTKEEELLELINKLNKSTQINGILVQLPLPEQINEVKILNSVLPEKDVDGFHPINVGKMLLGEPVFLPCTPFGVQQMLLRSGYDPRGRHVVIVGRSNIVGKPLAAILMQKKEGADATVTICHSRTKDISKHTREAEILIAAIGRAKAITAGMVSKGVVVIDVGVNRVDDPTSEKGYRLVGDVDFDEVSKVAEAISPVPGGVGPMTITMLLNNTVKAAKIQNNL